MKKQLHTKKKSHALEYLIINIFVFAGIGLLSFVVFNVSVFNQFTQAFKDFTLSDIYYSKILKQDSIYKGPLVLINIENKKRDEIAFLLQRLEEGKPKVIGLDIIFRNKIDTAPQADSILKETFAQYNNIVYPHIATFDNSLPETKNDDYFQTKSNSFINLIGEDPKFSTIRYFYPVYDNVPAFTTAVLQKYDSAKAQRLFNKGQQNTEIKYYGNMQNFIYRNFDEVMDITFNPEILKDKIVLLGYMGHADGTSGLIDEDRFFTPLNPRLSGRSHPDMYGTVLLANILRMELDKDYMYSFPAWLNFLVAFLLSWMLLPMFVHWYVHKPLWYHLMLVLAQFAVSILFVFLTLLLYTWFNLKIESASLLIAIVFMGDFLLFYHHIIKYFKHKRNLNFHSKFFEGAH